MVRQSSAIGSGRRGIFRLPWILVLHGKAAHARPIEMLLERAGYEVASASEIEEARTLFAYGRPDLIIVAAGGTDMMAQLATTRAVRAVTLADDEISNDAGDAQDRCSIGTLLKNVSKALALETTSSNEDGEEGEIRDA